METPKTENVDTPNVIMQSIELKPTLTKIILSDHSEPGKATNWIEIVVPISGNAAELLAVIQLKALAHARGLIAEKIRPLAASLNTYYAQMPVEIQLLIHEGMR